MTPEQYKSFNQKWQEISAPIDAAADAAHAAHERLHAATTETYAQAKKDYEAADAAWAAAAREHNPKLDALQEEYYNRTHPVFK
jgi:hypothetical protein